MRLLDTNIVIYALGRPHPYKESCARLFREIAQGVSGYMIDTELLQEVLHVYTLRAERRQAFLVFDNLLRLFADPIPIGRSEMVAARRLLELNPILSPRDAIHAAVVQTHGMEGIVTTDKAIAQIPGIAVFDPLALSPQR